MHANTLMCQCCFCGESLPSNEVVVLAIYPHWRMDEGTQNLYTHRACLRTHVRPEVPLLTEVVDESEATPDAPEACAVEREDGAVIDTVFAPSGRYHVVVYQRDDGQYSYRCFRWRLEAAEYPAGGYWDACDTGGNYASADRVRADALVALRAWSEEPL